MKAKFYLVWMVSLIALTMSASDFVDDINNGSGQRPAGRRVIYEMNVGSFTAEGTFAAAQQRLGELKTLGIDIVWLMPIYPRGGGINSPYAATDFQQTNPQYGTIADLKALVTAAHNLDMEVWLDWVPNHTATDARWVTEHPEYYKKRGDSFVHPNNYGDVYQLDYSNAALQKAMNDCLKFWIDEADVDGYRCDYISSPEIPTSYWQTTIPEIKGYKAGKTITFLGEGDIAQDAKRLVNVGFDYDYAWQFQSQLANFGPAGYAAARLKAFGNTLLDNSREQSFTRMLYVTNHDQNFNDGGHTLSALYGENRYALCVLAHTLYGMPLIYNGQETGGNQILDYFHDTKINWTSTDTKMKNTLRTLCALKHDVAALDDRTDVEWVTVTNNTSVLAFRRKVDDSEVLVVLNMATTAGSATLTGLTAGEWSLWLDSETIAQGTSRKQLSLPVTQTFNLDAKGYRVYVKGVYSEEDAPAPEAYIPTLDSNDEISIFFETPTADSYAVWAWGSLGGGEAYCTHSSWPGDGMTLMGQTDTGKNIYKWLQTKATEAPQYLIISKNGGNTKIYDGIDFVNHGYYVEGQTVPTRIITAATGLCKPTADRISNGCEFSPSGQPIQSNRPGIHIRDGKKYVVK